MLSEDYKEMLQLLIEEQVDFIIVGAYALERTDILEPLGILIFG